MKPTTVPFEGQKFRVLDDGSIVSESYAPTKTSNDFSLTAHVGTITAVRLDALTHPQLPRGGPGRSIDGTGALTEFKLRIQPTAQDAPPIDVLIRLLDQQREQLAAIAQSDETASSRLQEMIGLPVDACLQLTGQTPREFAAWMVVARAILNLDETITKS